MSPYHDPKRKRGLTALRLLAYASGYYSLSFPGGSVGGKGIVRPFTERRERLEQSGACPWSSR